MLERLEVTETIEGPHPGYEYVRAVASLGFDPGHPANAGVVDLDLAPRDAGGLVRAESDVRLLRPRDGGNGRLLVVVPNRGMVMGVPFSLDGDPMRMLGDEPDAGDAFLLRRGWTVAWIGWQWDVTGAGRLGLRVPAAEVEPGELRIEFRPDTVQAARPLGDSTLLGAFTDIPTADVEDPGAVLTVRDRPHGGEVVVPREQWRFPTATTVELDGGFQPFRWYTLRYRSTVAPVGGAGLLAFRDVAAHLRRGHEAAFGYGVSQSGRFLRQFLAEDRNADEDGDQVLDGVLAHIAGARRGEFNDRYGQPSLTHPMTPAYGPPYDSAALLARTRASGSTPKLVLTNSASEYWRGDAGLVSQDPDTGADLPEDPDTRAYLLSGTDHLGRIPIKGQLPLANPPHELDATPLLRALFLRLEAWVCDGVQPPPSRVPRQADGTAVSREEVLARFSRAALPDPDVLPRQPRIDGTQPAWALHDAEPLTTLVSAVDDDGNERAGVRLPAVQSAAAAFTGWNPRRPVPGLPAVLYEFVGSRLPRQSGRPVPGEAAVEAAARAAAGNLVADGLLLPEDVECTVAEALAQSLR
ncbi:alpha/beta hydrolase domain-containing protein [Blastococcus sp. URHD0036]|uniref:alpha/beta hydrolase domain-containing protein n=1 Tax=Blastococcus sp. URHD0036 TaxID=1380356 RepID=UPI00068DE0F4|nr:alpha/beta hydrolase domain-containing protein [Blastococcus sp. URHD0036]